MNEWFETHPFLKQMRRRLSVELAVCLLLFCGVFLAARYAGLASAGADAVLGKKKPVVFLDAGHGDFELFSIYFGSLKELFSETIRLKTGLPGSLSRQSTQKYPLRTN